VGFTTEQEDELWIRWRRGESSRLIGRALRCHPLSVRAFLARSGGVRPTPRRRSVRHLTATEREEVSPGIAAGLLARAIAALIGRSASTVSREIAHNGGRDGYRAAEAAAWDRGRCPKPSRLASNPALLADVRGRLEEDWSPEQIAAWLRREHLTDPTRWVSHETNYRTIYLAGRRELGARAARHLRSGRSVRHPRKVRDSHGRGRLRNTVSIRAALLGSTLVLSPVVALYARLSRGDS